MLNSHPNSYPSVCVGVCTKQHSRNSCSILFGIRIAKILELGVINSRNKNEIPSSLKGDTEGNC